MKQTLPHLLNPFLREEIKYETQYLVILRPSIGLVLLELEDFKEPGMRQPITRLDFNPYLPSSWGVSNGISCARVDWYPNGPEGIAFTHPYWASGTSKIDAWYQSRNKLQEVIDHLVDKGYVQEYRWVMEYYLKLLEGIHLLDDPYTKRIRCL